MSEKRSWDIQPNRKAQPQQQSSQSPVRAVGPDRRIPIPRPVRGASSKSALGARGADTAAPATKIIRRERVKQGREREPLKAQRRRARRRLSLILLVLFVVLVGAGFAGLWSPTFRVQHVEAAGPDATGVQATAIASLAGVYEYVLPRNSIFFFPQDSMRAEIMQQYPDISAISISLVSFDTIAINSIPRESAFLWCGAAYASPDATAHLVSTTASTTPVATSDATTSVIATPALPSCYDADSQGDVFALDTSASSDILRVYDSLASTTTASTSPLGQHVAEPSLIPNALAFVKEIKSLDVPIIALVIRGDEADLYAQSGTRITYVLGTEEASTQLAESAFSSLNLNDGSLEYVDLRFPGKVYFKKINASTAGTSATSTYSTAVSCYLSGKCQIH